MFFINPFIYGGAGGDFESIATISVGSGGASSIEFTSIPGTYQHLQIRALLRSNASADNANLVLTFNGATSNFAWHWLNGNGFSASATGAASQSSISNTRTPAANVGASVFGGHTIDVLDYAASSKNRVVRSFGGFNSNSVVSNESIQVASGLWASTSAVSTVTLSLSSGSFVQHSTAALYGIKAP